MEGFRRNKHYLKNLLRQVDVKIVFLQEIWLPFHDQKVINDYFHDYIFKIATPDMFTHNEDKLLQGGPIWHGAAIGWHTDINSRVTFPPSNLDRLIGIKYNLNMHSLLLISFYASTSGRDEDFMESLSHLSQYILLNICNGDKVIIGTDSNCSSKSTSRRKEAWNSFLETFSLRIDSTDDPTFHHNNGSSESTIDFFVTSSTLMVESL